MKEMLNEVRCLKSNEDMIFALAGQFKQLSHEPEKVFQARKSTTVYGTLYVSIHQDPTNITNNAVQYYCMNKTEQKL